MECVMPGIMYSMPVTCFDQGYTADDVTIS
jgi:hypothetical protein